MIRTCLLILLFIAALEPAQAITCLNDMQASNPDSLYSLHGDGTVTDVRTGLMWKQCAEGQTWGNGGCYGSATSVPWGPNPAYPQYKEFSALGLAKASNFAGYKDWRLPNIKELRSLVEECQATPAINQNIFPNTPGYSYFWSSTPHNSVGDSAWYVWFNDGSSGANPRWGVGFSVRLVRDAQ